MTKKYFIFWIVCLKKNKVPLSTLIHINHVYLQKLSLRRDWCMRYWKNFNLDLPLIAMSNLKRMHANKDMLLQEHLFLESEIV